ncbi:ABC transporter substrate-binding protein [Paenibacillus aceti]|uniref:ABC transporter substrate-binding protein n=1 Tax=Paenibacillus aceti TaxID=1820010 RepID=A0ABQ1VPF4_9BACL|nr:ABC transporter substrate-binding protein [Paenibacillus aceti]GGF85928.1 ABC transporter substrate-binding protein [Paenibacillus aceti]
MSNWKKIWAVGLLTFVLLVVAGCGANNATTNNAANGANSSANEASQSTNNSETKAEAQHTTYPLTVKDANDAEITFDAAPQKIVSLSPSETEGLFALGLDEQIVGVSDNDDYPEAALSKPKMGGFQVNVESIVATEPDLVVVTGTMIKAETIKSLTDLGIKVLQSNPKTIADVMDHIKTIGEITDHQAEAEQVVKQMQSELDQVTEAVKSVKEEDKKKVYIEFSPGWTVGKGEFMDEMITLAGGVNVASDVEGWSQINEENIIKANPDVVLYAKSVIENDQTLADIVKGRSGWDQINAVKNDQVIGLDDNLLSRPGPRVTQGLIEVAKAIYPDLMQP